MQNQRGFASTGVVIAIVLVILVLGGGAYVAMQQKSSPQGINSYALSSEGQSEDKKIGGMTMIGSIASQFEYEHKRYPNDMTKLQAEFNQNPMWSEKRSEGNPPKWSDYTYVGVDGGKSYVLRTTINPDSKLFDTYLKNLPQRRDGMQGGVDCDFAGKGYICFVPFSR